MSKQANYQELVDSADDFVCEVVQTLKSSSSSSETPKKDGRNTNKRSASVSDASTTSGDRKKRKKPRLSENAQKTALPKIKLEADLDQSLEVRRSRRYPVSSRGRCPLCNRKQGFGLVEAEDMANELYGVVQHVEMLLEQAQDSLCEIKAQFKSTIWAEDRWRRSYAARPEFASIDSGVFLEKSRGMK